MITNQASLIRLLFSIALAYTPIKKVVSSVLMQMSKTLAAIINLVFLISWLLIAKMDAGK